MKKFIQMQRNQVNTTKETQEQSGSLKQAIEVNEPSTF